MNFKKTSSIFLLTIACFTAASAQSFNKAKMDSLMDAIVANDRGMGSLAISKNGQIIYQRATGYAKLDGDTKIPADVKTKYRIGSISKMFTTVMALQLIEEGKLSLTTPLAKYYPQFPNADKITIAMLLQHRTGLFNFTNDPAFIAYLSQPKSHQQMLTIMAAPKPNFEPDTKFEYSNTNYVLLGYIIEQLTKKTYTEAVKQRIVLKAGLTDTYYGGKIATANHEAFSYERADNSWKPAVEADMSIPGGAGAMVSTPADLDKFIEALFAGKLISPKSLAMMQTMKDSYGFGMISTPFEGHKGYGHTGGIDAFGSQVIYFPEDKMAIAYIKNADDGVMGDVLKGAMSIYFNKPYITPNFKPIAVSEADLVKFTGVYATPALPFTVTVSLLPTGLIAQATGQGAFPLKPVSANMFEFSASGIVIEFDAAKSQMAIKQAGKTTVMTKNATVKTLSLKTEDLDKYLGVYASPGFPMKITVTKNNTTLMAQATGQAAFSTEPTAPNVFEFAAAGIMLEFDPAKSQMILKQGGHNTTFTKEK